MISEAEEEEEPTRMLLEPPPEFLTVLPFRSSVTVLPSRGTVPTAASASSLMVSPSLAAAKAVERSAYCVVVPPLVTSATFSADCAAVGAGDFCMAGAVSSGSSASAAASCFSVSSLPEASTTWPSGGSASSAHAAAGSSVRHRIKAIAALTIRFFMVYPSRMMVKILFMPA